MSKKFTHVSSLEQVKTKKPTFLAIGVFDGVHLGHQKLIESMVEAARSQGARPAVLTFFPHPATVISGRRGRIYLTTLEERVRLLADLGLDLVVTHDFDETVRQTRAADFVDRLCYHLNLKELWGGQFGLGYNREGDLPFLRRLGSERGFTVRQYSTLVKWGGEPVSSSRARHALAAGAMDELTGCLGRRYRLSGVVVEGDGRGRQLGIPTANLDFWDELLLPANGVYAAFARRGRDKWMAATNVGVRPTVNGHHLNVEAHLLEFDGDLYGQTLTLEFVQRIRDERKFAGLEELVTQIKSDINSVRRQLTLDRQG